MFNVSSVLSRMWKYSRSHMRSSSIDTQDAIFTVITGSEALKKHSLQRQLKGNLRKAAKAVLVGKGVKEYKDELAAQKLNDSGQGLDEWHASHIYSQAGQEARDEEIKLFKYPGDPATSTLSIMEEFPDCRVMSLAPRRSNYIIGAKIKYNWPKKLLQGTFPSASMRLEILLKK